MAREGHARLNLVPRYSVAYSGFVQRLSEVELILRKAKEASVQAPNSANIAFVNALCRSGVVLLSSHIEGYIKELGETALDRIARHELPKTRLGGRFQYYLSRDLITEIKDTQDPANIATKLGQLFDRDEHIWNAHPRFSGPLSTEIFLGGFANPKHEKIEKFFKRYGYDSYSRDLAKRLTRDYRPCTNMVDHVVDQRNKIAHGDMVISSTPGDLADMIRLVKLYCREGDRVVGDWFRTQQCAIR